MFEITFLLIFLFLISVIFTWLIRDYLLKKMVVDFPNERSSHCIPTPRGGGVSVVFTFYIGIFILWVLGITENRITLVVFTVPTLVAIVGFLDDVNHVPIKGRLTVHFVSALLTIYLLGFAPIELFPGYFIDSTWMGAAIVSVVLVWLLNMFNFMDGIDGIACCEAVFIAWAGALFTYLEGSFDIALILMTLSVVVLGFIYWNWPPAKIFLGDVGSGFLGITLGMLAYSSMLTVKLSVWIWMILFGLFVVDATYTLAVRVVKQAEWYRPHCTHAYQKAAHIYGHKKVSSVVCLINVLWLFPLALLTFIKPNLAMFFCIVAYLPLVVLTISFGAGNEAR